VVAAGGVAAAIGAIMALWPGPPPELQAEISEVSIDKNVTLSEYRLRSQVNESAPTMTNAAHLVAELTTQTTTQILTTTEETTTEETTTSEEPTGTLRPASALSGCA
jgi:hypothetical protein